VIGERSAELLRDAGETQAAAGIIRQFGDPTGKVAQYPFRILACDVGNVLRQKLVALVIRSMEGEKESVLTPNPSLRVPRLPPIPATNLTGTTLVGLSPSDCQPYNLK
jgi:hypothetical protein